MKKWPPLLGLRRCLAAAALLLPTLAAAQPNEEAVKAAFLPKFARYVQWPGASHPGPHGAFQLCVIGQDPFGRSLDAAAAREIIDGRTVTVRRLGSADDAAGCHLAYVHAATAEDSARWLLAMRDRPILTITDSRYGAERGIIHFTVANGRVRFFIDDAAAGERGLTISSRLLALALGVRQRRS